MPRKLTGQVDQAGNKWRARLRGGYVGLFESEKDAWDAIALAKKRQRAPERETVRTLAAEWFKQRELNGEVKKIKKQQSDWNHRIAKHAKWMDWDVRRPRTMHIQRLLADLCKQPATQVINRKVNGVWVPEYIETGKTLSRESVTKPLSLLKLFFDWCVREGKREDNPARKAKVPVRKKLKRKGNQRIIHLTRTEVGALFKLDLPPLVKAVFAVAIYAGLRRAEIWGLRWEHVDLDGERTIRVRYSYDGECKSETSVREVPLLPFARKALKAYLHTLNPRPITGLVFPADGKGCHSDGYDCEWRNHAEKRLTRLGWRTKAGIRREVTFRCLRHTTGCHLISGTFLGNDRPLTLEQLKELLGHSTIKVTERHYGYLLPDNLSDVMHGTKAEEKNAIPEHQR